MLTLNEAEIEGVLSKVDFDKMNGLIPVVVQDSTSGRILMQAFMDEKALRLTLKTGKAHYYSRTRGSIWRKGEESGHEQIVQDAILDCDMDSLLLRVVQMGVCCHTGEETCFHNLVGGKLPREEFDSRYLDRLYEIVMDRIRNPKPASYVSTLTGKGLNGILRKIGEEAVELILAARNGEDGLIHEASDLIFHLQILMAFKGLSMKDILYELRTRHRTRTRKGLRE
ncbi:MAG: bifunctional phosphoribosyl-AMP cyclohydrolase/phosphoribosyl-ATP diphosphatase HisIE [Candidatus Bathyarchaeia archaeon]